MSTHSDLREAETAVIEEALGLIKSHSWRVGTNVRRMSVDREHYIKLGEACVVLQHRRLSLDGDGAHNCTDTSKIAARLPGKNSLRRQVLDCLVVSYQHHGDGMTTDAVELRIGRAHTSVSSAMNYLLNHGLVGDSGLRRKTRASSPAIVYAPTELAMQFVRDQWLLDEGDTT